MGEPDRLSEIPVSQEAVSSMDALMNLYNHSPRFMQNMYVNAYGIRNLSRFRKWDGLIRDIEFTERLDRQGQIEYVEARLKDIITHALTNVPFYRKFSGLKTDLDHRNVFEVLKELPVTNKETINRDPGAFLGGNPEQGVVSKTSGTTGIPFTIHMDSRSFLLGDALWWRRTRWAGYQKGDWIARLVGDPVIPLQDKDPAKPWRMSWTDKRIYFSTFHLTEKTAARIGEFLNRRKPAYVMGYPSSLEILCRYLKQTGFQMDWNLKNVLFSSEPMHAHQEIVIREVLQAEIRGLYGSGEKVVSAAQCQHGNYHLSLVDGYVEGQFGIMDGVKPAAVTTLTNKLMPLIRYQVGDEIDTQPSLECGCGRTLPIISPVITKHEDYIITPSGRKIAPSAVVWAFIHQEIKDINKSQVVQEDERTVKVYLNTDQENFLKYRDVLKESMTEVFFGEMDVEIVKTDRIDVLKSGKSRFIVNKLRHRFHEVSTGTSPELR
jgi:phenylacetate-CoA ligase